MNPLHLHFFLHVTYEWSELLAGVGKVHGERYAKIYRAERTNIFHYFKILDLFYFTELFLSMYKNKRGFQPPEPTPIPWIRQ